MNFLTAYTLSKKCILLGWACALLAMLLVCPAKTAESTHIRYNAETPSEYEMKAIYLYNFLKFIKWPNNKCQLHEGRSHQIAVLGDSPFNKVLIALQEKLKGKNKELQLTFYGPYREDIEFSCCCLLFITKTERDNLPTILDKLAGKPVLTVADANEFINLGVMITLVPHKNKIRWAINRQPVNDSGLKMSAKLLDIAVQIINQ